MSELYELSLAEVSQRLASQELSSVQLTTAILERIKKTQPKLNSFITVTSEEALQKAKEVDEKRKLKKPLSPLAGVPIALKDIFLTKGIRTTCCSKILSNFVPPYDSTVVRKLKENDFVLVGKLNQDEFAMGSSNENFFY